MQNMHTYATFIDATRTRMRLSYFSSSLLTDAIAIAIDLLILNTGVNLSHASFSSFLNEERKNEGKENK